MVPEMMRHCAYHNWTYTGDVCPKCSEEVKLQKNLEEKK